VRESMRKNFVAISPVYRGTEMGLMLRRYSVNFPFFFDVLTGGATV
jgi:hypothetical protein